MQPNETASNPLSVTDFEMLGVDHVAYVKKVSDGTSPKFAIYAANGAEIALMETDREVAFAAIRQNDMQPVSVH